MVVVFPKICDFKKIRGVIAHENNISIWHITFISETFVQCSDILTFWLRFFD